MKKNAENNVNYQERAKEFSVGDVATPFGWLEVHSGRVTAVWPAIGMVDVEFPQGNKRYPVEDLQRIDKDGNADPPRTNTAPGGGAMTPVSMERSASRVAQAWHKQSLYWADKDRRYKMTRVEQDSGPCCPRCGPDQPLKRAVYKRRDGTSDKLHGCPSCMFLIKDADIINPSVEVV